MRCLIVLCTMFFSTLAFADESSPQFGDYGYNHHYLHQKGVIQELMEKTEDKCCDGGEGGECRETEVVWRSGVPYAYLDGKWCEITKRHKIRMDIESLPPHVKAVVCAGNTAGNNICPTAYCTAIHGGSM